MYAPVDKAASACSLLLLCDLCFYIFQRLIFKRPFAVKKILLYIARILAEEGAEVFVYLFSVGQRSAEIFFINFFNPHVDREGVALAEPEQRNAVRNLRANALIG